MSGEDKEEARKIIENINCNLSFLNRKYPFLDLELLENKLFADEKIIAKNYSIKAYIPREEIT